MTDLKVGVVDAYVILPKASGWKLLALRRGSGTRSTGAWEGVHGRMEASESPELAAIREVGEETGLSVDRLYNVCCQPFYLHKAKAVQMAVVFAAFVTDESTPVLGPEHDAFEWLPYEEGIDRLTWPRSKHALRDIRELLKHGNAGPVEDVMRVF